MAHKLSRAEIEDDASGMKELKNNIQPASENVSKLALSLHELSHK